MNGRNLRIVVSRRCGWLRIFLAISGIGLTEKTFPSYSFAQSPQRDEIRQQIEKAFSPVGHWTITRMEVKQDWTANNGGANATVNLKSILVGGGFTVAGGGSISGKGKVAYQYNVAGGGPIPMAGPYGALGALGSVGLHARASAFGERNFSLTGQVDLESRTFLFSAFRAEGPPLKATIVSGGRVVDIPPWPPMTKVETTGRVAGASMVLQASGVVGSCVVSFEAVKARRFGASIHGAD